MKLRNKITGEIIHYTGSQMIDVWYDKDNANLEYIPYSSLTELNSEWEDMPEEPKEYWFISDRCKVFHTEDTSFIDKERKTFGNYFETKEEAEKAVEKLRAWKRLKDNGFKLKPVIDDFFCLDMYWTGKEYDKTKEDLKIVFGGE